MKPKYCNPCNLSKRLTYCGEDLPNTDIKNGDLYSEVLKKIDDSIQNSGGGSIPATRTVNTGNGLTGGGTLENDITIELSQSSINNLALASTAVQPSALGNYVPTSRTVSAGTGLTGGGALSANQTLSLSTTTINSLNKADNAIPVTDILYGSETFTLSGVETVFTIPHGMSSIPSSFALTFSDGGNLDFIQSQRAIDATNITITCSTPPNGEITVFWQVFK